MEFHIYCLFSHCQRVKVLNLCTLTNEATLCGNPNRCFGVFPLFSWSVLLLFEFQMKAQFGQPRVLKALLMCCFSFSFAEGRVLSNMWLPELGFHLNPKGKQDKPRKVGTLPELCHPSGVSLTRITFLSIPSLATLRQRLLDRAVLCMLSSTDLYFGANKRPLYKRRTTKKHKLLWTGLRCSLPQGFPISFLENQAMVGLYLPVIISNLISFLVSVLTKCVLKHVYPIPELVGPKDQQKGLKISCGNLHMNWDI